MLRLIISVVSVSLGLALLGFGLIFWQSQSPSIVSASALGAAPDPALVELLRADAASAVLGWWAQVLLVIALCGAIWLILALRRRPQTPTQARSGALAWWLLLSVGVAGASVASYLIYSNQTIAPSWRLALAIVGTITVPVVYWLITAFGVKNEMAPSVPLALAVRS